MKNLDRKIEEIINKLIEDYYIPEGNSSEMAISQLHSLFREMALELIGENGDFWNKDDTQVAMYNRQEQRNVLRREQRVKLEEV